MNSSLRVAEKQRDWKLAGRILVLASTVLFVKVFAEILYQYRWYFPPDFDEATFLIGRRKSFVGIYSGAFYVHIIASPIALAAGVYLFTTGVLGRVSKVHRAIGKLELILILFAVAPSGFVMSTQAYTGAIAGAGFAVLAMLTAGTVVAAITCARKRDLKTHRLWATRCFILLCSPLLLRVMNGVAGAMQLEADWVYQTSAWLSWLLPLLVFELARKGWTQLVAAFAPSRSATTA